MEDPEIQLRNLQSRREPISNRSHSAKATNEQKESTVDPIFDIS